MGDRSGLYSTGSYGDGADDLATQDNTRRRGDAPAAAFPLIRTKLLEKLAGYIHTKELEDIDEYVVPASLDDDQGILGALQLGVLANIESINNGRD